MPLIVSKMLLSTLSRLLYRLMLECSFCLMTFASFKMLIKVAGRLSDASFNSFATILSTSAETLILLTKLATRVIQKLIRASNFGALGSSEKFREFVKVKRRKEQKNKKTKKQTMFC